MGTTDADRLLEHFDKLDLQPVDGARGWQHMGAVITDASLQASMKYKTTVLPRVRALLAEWPDATTTSAFVERLGRDDVAAVLRWPRDSKKMRMLDALAKFLADEQVETTSDLRTALEDSAFRARLRTVKGVGPKTVDYLAILVGSTEDVAVDSQLRAFARDAGITVTGYDDLRAVVTAAAATRGCAPGALDAAIWAHQSGARD